MLKPISIVVTTFALGACVATTKVSEEQGTDVGHIVETITADEIHSVFPWKYDFQLHRNRENHASFAFYGESANDFIKIECAPAAVFSIVSTSGIKGGISIGVCSESRGYIESLIGNAVPRMNETIEALGKVGTKVETMRQRMGWQYAKTTLSDGSELHYFPVLLVGHGILTAPTAVLLLGEKIVVIQAGTAGLCSYRERDPELCTDAKNRLFELLRRIHTRL